MKAKAVSASSHIQIFFIIRILNKTDTIQTRGVSGITSNRFLQILIGEFNNLIVIKFLVHIHHSSFFILNRQAQQGQVIILIRSRPVRLDGGEEHVDHLFGSQIFRILHQLYQTLIALFTYLPLQPLHAYKLFSCCFDVLLALLTAWIVYRVSEQRPELCALAAFTMIYLSPIVCINSAWWAQCDAIYTFFGLAALYLLSKKQDLTAFLLYGVSMTFKLQAIFLMPVMLFVVFCRKKRHLFYVLLIPAVMVILSSAGLAAGRRITDVFSIYLNQTSSYHAVALNYPSVWGLLSDTGHLINYFSGHEAVSAEQLYDFIKYPAILITGAALAVLMLLWLKKKAVIDLKSILMMAFLLCYTCVIFLPSMHERYGYVYEILALIIAFFNRRTISLVIIMYCVTLITYIHFLSDNYFGDLVNLKVGTTKIN